MGVGGVIDSETLRKPIIAFVFNQQGPDGQLDAGRLEITKIEK